jgi:hypothetical protein
MLEEVNLLKYSNKPRVVRLIFFLGAASVLAQTPLERSSAMQALDQWSSVCEKDGLVLWGKSLCGPMLLVDASTRSAIANSPDPRIRYRSKGIFTVTQLSYTFRPRRTPKRAKSPGRLRYPALQALAIRENTVYIHGIHCSRLSPSNV